MVTSNLHAKLDLDSVAALLSLGRFEETVHIFGILEIPAQLFPSIIIN